MNDLEKFEQKHKENLIQTITSHLSVGLDEFVHLMGFGKKTKSSNKRTEKHRISVADDKYENSLIAQRK